MSLGYSVNVSDKSSVLRKSNLLFLPGVGSFDAAMDALNKKDLTQFIIQFSESGKTIIGICLGMQLLFTSSKEGNPIKGLSLLPGRITKLSSIPTHIGWNSIQNTKPRSPFKEFNEDFFYFNHSFAFEGSDNIVLAKSKVSLSGEKVAAIVKKKNIVGIQFHPEKSQFNGSKLLRHFILEDCNA